MLTRDFIRTGTTANTLRYRELPALDQHEAFGTLYLRKNVAEELGNPERLRVAFKRVDGGEADA